MRTNLGWLREHNHRAYSIHAYHLGEQSDHVTAEVRRLSRNFKHFPGQLEEAARAIREDELHVLVFLDLGLNPITTQLAALRLAPVQCATAEAPYTSGLPTVDYFLSSELMEPADAQQHYLEKLVVLPGVGVCFQKPSIPFPLLSKSREEFGLRPEAAVYLCCQGLSKYLPQHDDVFVRIAQKVRDAQFIFLGSDGMTTVTLKNRLTRAFGLSGLKASDHCVFLRRGLPLLDYWNLHVISDAFLDTIGWSGCVSTFEAIACNTPVVTLPGAFMRCRHTYGILKQLQVFETIAASKEEYVDIAVRLGADPAWRGKIVARIAGGHGVLYSDTRSVLTLESFFRQAVNEP
jgi:predicted O-linked N-acetylglucosamine transferase (SPINDLY family)